VLGFPLGGGDHVDCVPRTAFEEGAVGTFAGAQLARKKGFQAQASAERDAEEIALERCPDKRVV